MELLNFEGQSVLDSRDVAEMISKDHKHLMRDIRLYTKDLEDSPKLDPHQFFIPSTYTSKQGKVLPNYLLTKQGCEFVANKMTGKKGNQFTAQYVSLFNSMKKTIETAPQEILDKLHKEWNVPTTLSGALQLAANQQIQLEKQKPKVDYYDSQMRNPGLMTTTEIAKDFGWSASKLNKWLAAHHIIYKQGGHWVLYQKYCGEGYTQYEPFAYKKNNRQGIRNNLKWTQKGRKFIYDKLAEHDIHPTVEQLDLLEM
ncbi:phage antirepressor KilAC domain-containing protein [Lactobacillus crispatus]|uniref:phage antirepressor KilAC domain-containing protein n=1 Tax=Lactobacillus crispatus TaxID=47770 RepID=UPI003975E0CB